jgi:hypothetical protein
MKDRERMGKHRTSVAAPLANIERRFTAFREPAPGKGEIFISHLFNASSFDNFDNANNVYKHSE